MKIILCITTAALLLIGCRKDDEDYSAGNAEAVPTDRIIKITKISEINIPADTETTSTISLHITPDALAANRSISLSTTLGKFSNSQKATTLTVDAHGDGTFTLSSADIGVATVTATVKGISVDTTLNFQAAPPDDLLLTADHYILDTTQSAVITVMLFRDPGNGVVTNPQKVNFSITGTGADQLILPAFAYSTAGNASATLSNPAAIKGSFIVSVSINNSKGIAIVKTLNMKIN
jgi:hypothetical protein